MKPGHLLIGLLTTFLLFTSCSKSPVQEDPLPERYLRSSEVQVIQAHLIKLNTLPGYFIYLKLSAEASERWEAIQWIGLSERAVVTLIGSSETVEIPSYRSIESLFSYPCSIFCGDYLIGEDNTLPAQIMTSENYLPTLLRALDLDEETFQKLLTDSPV
ncbi:MAG: hypothetical protein J5939_08685 [Bacteroidales bacterium]|nr:hypothetical protein [Bacteroidales bacterium]